MLYRIEKLSADDTSHAAQHSAGEALARDMLCAALCRPPETLVFLKEENGKPYLEGTPLHFNISHSGDRVLCAVHTAPIGADVQQILPLREKVIKRVCTPAEIAYIGNDPARFTQVWTRKEAYAKLTGKGLSVGLENIPVATENELLPLVEGCRVLTETIDRYVFSLVWEESDLEDR